MEQAQQTVWGRNTVFVLVGDHGGPASSAYDYNLPLNQIPCFFVGSGITDTTLTAPAQQQDIAPTLLGLLGLPYTENTMGINQLQHSRDYTYFVNNDHLGCTDGEWLYSYSINTQQEYLYRIGEDAKDYSASEPQRMEHIRRYAVQHQLINLLSVQNQWITPCE